MFDLRIFLLAALIASPAAFRAAEGQLSLDEALTRLLIVMVGATLAGLLVRTLWPLLSGTTTGEALDANAESLLAGDLDASGTFDVSSPFGGFDSGEAGHADDGLGDLLSFDDVTVE